MDNSKIGLKMSNDPDFKKKMSNDPLLTSSSDEFTEMNSCTQKSSSRPLFLSSLKITLISQSSLSLLFTRWSRRSLEKKRETEFWRRERQKKKKKCGEEERKKKIYLTFSFKSWVF